MQKSSKIGTLFLCAIFAFMLILTSAYTCIAIKSTSKTGVTIVLDAGHGGRDGGSVGVNGTIERDINLKYIYALKTKLVELGYIVELTRKTEAGLYSPFAKNKKMSDMQKRIEIINQTNPNLVISLHMNSFSSSKASGANTFYRAGDNASKTCADLIQQSLVTYCGETTQTSKVGDYYILNSSYYTSVLIECGFLSNAEEEQKLNTQAYQQLFVDSVAKAVLLYFG